MSEKTEHPTSSRLRQARRDGKTAKSRDLTQAISGGVWLGILSGLFGWMLGNGVGAIRALVDAIGHGPWGAGKAVAMQIAVGAVSISVVAVLGGACIAGGIEIMQTRGMLSGKPLAPDFNRLNPVSHIKSLFSLKTVVEFIKGSLKIVVILGATLLLVRWSARDALLASRIDPLQAMGLLTGVLFRLALVVALALLVIGCADALYQRFEYIKSLRMSKDEVKRDYKQQEGNPDIKGERQRLHGELSNGD